MGNTFKPGFFLFTYVRADLRKKIMAAYPHYHIKNPHITELDINNAFLSWQAIMGGEDIEAYIVAKRSPDFEFTTCLSWFFTMFYNKFFELCPESKELFSKVSISVQGRLLAGVISSSFEILKNPERLEQRIIRIVNRHNPMNIKAVYYSLMGEALLWTLNLTLGSLYTAECELAWTKIYSYLLNIIIPRAVEYEYKLVHGKGNQIGKRSDSHKETSDNDKSSIVSSKKGIRSSIEERIRKSTSLLHIKEGSSAKAASGKSWTSRTCPLEVHDVTETRKFEPVDYVPFSKNTANSTVRFARCPAKAKAASLRNNKISTTCPTTPMDLDFKPIQVESDYNRQDLRTCPKDITTHSDRKNNMTDSQHKNTPKKTLVTIDSYESEDIKLPYFNHTGKYPKRPLSSIATTGCNMSDISYDDFKVNRLNRFNDQIKTTKK